MRENVRGPRFARLVPVKLVKSKGRAALVQEKGQEPKAVPASLTLPWFEGLLLLAELEVKPQAAGASKWHADHLPVLRQERDKYSNKVLSAANYAKVSLLGVAVTGPRVTDSSGKQWSHRRELQRDTPQTLDEGTDSMGFWRMREVADYMPPWTAFCHPKCGIYQDHYLVRWAQPFSEVDYGETETGCEDGFGATWEPDECLPACCDALRLAAKRRWFAAQQQRESQAAVEFREKRAAEVAALVAEAEENAPEGTDDLDAPVWKRARQGEDESDSVAMWDTIMSGVDLKACAKDAQFLTDLSWQIGKGTLARQLMRAIDACVREKRVKLTWAVVRTMLRAANEGPLSQRTRLATCTACDLAKAKRITLRVIETIIGDLAKSVQLGSSASTVDGAAGATAWVLVHMFPQKKDVGWGWVHSGWLWSAWWDFVARCLQGFQPVHAFAVLRTALELMLSQAGPGASVRELPTWSDDPQRIKELRRRLCKTGGLGGGALLQELDHLGIDDAKPVEPEALPKDDLEG